MKKKIVTLFFLVIGIQSFSQIVEFEDISKRNFNGAFVIINQENDVSGYYTYYKREKEDNGMRLFEFSFTDKELKNVVRYPLSVHKNAEVNNVVFNGKYMLISYDDIKNKKIVFTTISPDGTKLGYKEYEVAKRKNIDGDFYPSDGDGFYLVKINKVKGYQGYIIQKYDNNLNELWTQEIMPETKGRYEGFEVEDLLVSKNRLVIAQNTYLSMAKKRLNIVGIDSKSGTRVFDYETYDGSSTPVYNNMKIDGQGDIIISGTYENKEYISDVNFDGVFLLKLTSEGKKSLYTKVSYKENIQEVMKRTSRTSALGSKDKLFLEDVIYEGNSYYLIGEIFKKNIQAANASGALKLVQTVKDLATGKWMGYDDGSTAYTFQIMDYMVIKFDDKGNFVETKPLIKENYNKVSVYYPFNMLVGMRLAKTMSDYGWFDYGFTTKQANGKNIMLCSDQSTNKPDVYFYEMDNQFKKNTIDLKQRAKVMLEDDAKVNYFTILKNENNKFVAAYYQRKVKKASFTLENFE